jgi:hypothetical protein
VGRTIQRVERHSIPERHSVSLRPLYFRSAVIFIYIAGTATGLWVAPPEVEGTGGET